MCSSRMMQRAEPPMRTLAPRDGYVRSRQRWHWGPLPSAGVVNGHILRCCHAWMDGVIMKRVHGRYLTYRVWNYFWYFQTARLRVCCLEVAPIWHLVCCCCWWQYWSMTSHSKIAQFRRDVTEYKCGLFVSIISVDHEQFHGAQYSAARRCRP
jgi:hypothetical protein